jgi:hypothetical protein
MGAYADRDAELGRMGFESYKAYRSSDLWKGIRKRVLLRDGRKCRCCGGPAIVVHHDSYGPLTLRGETLASLYSLCDPCHEAIEFDGERKRSFTEVRVMLQRRLKPSVAAPRPAVAKPAKSSKRKLQTRLNGKPLSPEQQEMMRERRALLKSGRGLPKRLKLKAILRWKPAATPAAPAEPPKPVNVAPPKPARPRPAVPRFPNVTGQIGPGRPGASPLSRLMGGRMKQPS